MAKMKETFYVSAYFDKEGGFSHFSLLTYRPSGEMTEYGMTVFLRKEEFEYEVPDNPREVNILAANALEAFILKEKGAHQMRMMRMEAAVNAMRGLGYSEIIHPERNFTGHRDGVSFDDVQAKPVKPHWEDDDDGSSF